MRYNIMLQLVTATTVGLIAAAALFAWMQNRPRARASNPWGDPPVTLAIGSGK